MKRRIMILAIAPLSAANADRTTTTTASTGREIERTCVFGEYGPVTIHQGGIGRTYIIIRGRRYPSTGGADFVQSDEDDDVAVTFDRRGRAFYRGEIAGKGCRITRRPSGSR